MVNMCHCSPQQPALQANGALGTSHAYLRADIKREQACNTPLILSARQVLVDLTKVLMLTLTSPVFMHRLPKGSLRRFLGTQGLRNFHKFIEGVL